ncbi:MAG: HAD family hydrolase [Clostridia bacterium]|nr:HAD family hydrolase [Clostridia bacterium]
MKTTILFDLDGTLLYTIKDIKHCLNEIITQFGYDAVDEQTTLKCIGYGAKELIIRATGEKDVKKVETMLSKYLVLQEACDNSKTELYAGLDELLITLKKDGYKLGIVSNKPDSATQAVYKQLLSKYNFDFVTGCVDHLSPKPSADLVNLCLQNLNSTKEETLYVGDSEVDVKTFVNAQVDGIGVLWGYRKRELLEKEGCTRFANTATELYEIIKNF